MSRLYGALAAATLLLCRPSRAFHTGARGARWPLSSALAGSKQEVLALDFDGVLCASSTESSVSALIAAEKHWPAVVSFRRGSSAGGLDEFSVVSESLQTLRPIIETGYENMLLARHLLLSLRRDKLVDTDDILNNWGAAYIGRLLTEYGASKDELITAFGRNRDDMIREDLAGWVALNPVFPHVKPAMAGKNIDYTIVTTKQRRFVDLILSSSGIAPPPQDKLFDLDSPFGPKSAVLAEIVRRGADTAGGAPLIHFVEGSSATYLL